MEPVHEPLASPAAPEGGVPAPALPVGRPGLPVHLVLCFVQVTFGVFHVVGKAVLAEMAPLALAGIRALVAAPVLMLLAWRKDRLLPRRRDLPVLALLGGRSGSSPTRCCSSPACAIRRRSTPRSSWCRCRG